MPYGILRRADVAEVVALATEPGPVTLYPALTVEPQGTFADFDARHTEGADYVIVPAMRRNEALQEGTCDKTPFVPHRTGKRCIAASYSAATSDNASSRYTARLCSVV